MMRTQASPLVVQSLAQLIAVHLARNYGVTDEEPHGSSPSLPGHKLRQITGWMAEHVAEEFSLDRLAAQAGAEPLSLPAPVQERHGRRALALSHRPAAE
jgi:transcriptional regulator GlxA family with amidase domain